MPQTIDWEKVERDAEHAIKHGNPTHFYNTLSDPQYILAAVRELKIAHDALEQAEDALFMSYQVQDFPANGDSEQDHALRAVRAVLARSEMKETRGSKS